MKSIISIGTLFLALSLCNLMGRRSANNSNSNTSPSGTSTETTSTENSNATPIPPPPPPAVDTSAPPPGTQPGTLSKNSNTAAPSTVSAGPPGVATLPNSNRKSKASVPSDADNTNQDKGPAPPRAPISGGVLNGKAIKLVQPPYPAIARAAHVSGRVVVQVLVDELGNVVSANAVSGHPLLQGAAVAAARASKFSPTVLSGQPVKVTGVIIYNFVAN